MTISEAYPQFTKALLAAQERGGTDITIEMFGGELILSIQFPSEAIASDYVTALTIYSRILLHSGSRRCIGDIQSNLTTTTLTLGNGEGDFM